MQVTCPKCSTSVDIDPAERDDKGRVRLRCGSCDAKLLIKVKAPALKLDEAIPSSATSPPEPGPPPEPEPEPEPEPTARSGGGLDLTALTLETGIEGDSVDASTTIDAAWMVVVDKLDEGGISELRRVMMRIGRFKRNPNKLHDLTSDLPFVLGGLTKVESAELNATIDSLLGTCRVGLEAELLDGDGTPYAATEVPLEVAGEAYDEDSGELFQQDDEPVPEEGLLIAGEEDDEPVPEEGLLIAGEEDDEPEEIGEEPVGDADSEEDSEPVPEEGLVVAGDEEEDDDDIGEAFADTVAVESTSERMPLPTREAISADDLSGIDLSVADNLGEVGYTTPPAPPPSSGEAHAIDLSDLTGGDDSQGVGDRSAAPVAPKAGGVLLATVDQFPGLDDIIGLVSASVVVAAADLEGRNRAVKLEAALNAAQVGLKRNASEQGAAAVVGVRTITASLPDGSVLVVMQGTATA